MIDLTRVWGVDSEWGYKDDRVGWESMWRPVVLCLLNAGTGQRLAFWADDSRLRDFFRDHFGDTYVAHVAQSEMKYIWRLAAPLPPSWFCTAAGWRWLKNRPTKLGHHTGLSKCLHALGLPHLAPEEKKSLQDEILHLRFGPEDRQRITGYCMSDCEGTLPLYRYLVDRVPATWMASHALFLAAVTRAELRGVPWDVRKWERLLEAAPRMLAALRDRVNAIAPVYVGATFKRKRFHAWRRSQYISWPEKISEATGLPYLPVDDDTLEDMELRHPFIALLRQTLKTHRALGKRKMVVDLVNERHYYENWPLGSLTGRSQPKKFVFSGPKWQRHFIVPPSPDHILLYTDFVSQEIGIAASLAHDATMLADYAASDCHMSFAIRNGAAPRGATKKTHPHARKVYKTCNLGVLCRQSAFGMAARLGIPHHEAAAIVARHKNDYRDFWTWSERYITRGYDTGLVRTPCGWRAHVPPGSNERTWANFPIQSVGADILRAAVCYLDRQNVQLLATVHDGFLLTCRRDQLADLRAAIDFAFRQAVEHSLPGSPLRWDYGDDCVFDERFEDDDGAAMWGVLMDLLKEEDERKRLSHRVRQHLSHPVRQRSSSS
jgi:hypothetical protein